MLFIFIYIWHSFAFYIIGVIYETNYYINNMDNYNPWNKWKMAGKKKPLTPTQIRTIRSILANQWQVKELSLFSLAIDSMLRSSDLLKLRVYDLFNDHGEIRKEIPIKQKKTGERHIIELTNTTINILIEYIQVLWKFDDDYLFTSFRNPDKPLSWQYYRRLVKKWVKSIWLSPDEYSTHSLRRTRSSFIYKKTGNIKVVQELLWQTDIRSTSEYLDISKKDAWKVAREYEL